MKALCIIHINERNTTMYEIKNFLNNDDIKVINKLGAFTVIEY